MKKPALITLIILGTLFASSSANADEVSFMMPLMGDAVPGGEAVMFPKFDPAMGMLTGVMIDMMGGGFVEIPDVDVPVDESSFVFATISGSLIIPDLLLSDGISLDGGFVLDGPFMGDLFVDVIGGGSILTSDPAELLGFTGPPGEMVEMFVDYDSFLGEEDFGAFADSDLMVGFAGIDGGDVTVTYTFVVPEPGSASILFGTCAAIFIRRRQRSFRNSIAHE